MAVADYLVLLEEWKQQQEKVVIGIEHRETANRTEESEGNSEECQGATGEQRCKGAWGKTKVIRKGRERKEGARRPQ